ncbi:MAG: hypothetical protein OEV00_12775, partial [Acidobacteriota bacterium]|nr:hypothetical protein [Acidobacteriota bacterium]
MSSHLRSIMIWAAIIAVAFIGYRLFEAKSVSSQPMDESDFYLAVADGEIHEVRVTGDQFGYEIEGKFAKPRISRSGREIKSFKTYVVKDESLMSDL